MDNKQKKASKKPIIIISVVLVAAIGILLAAYFLNRPDTNKDLKKISIEVIADGETEKVFTVSTDAEFLGEVLTSEGIAEGETGQYGMFITKVNGREADSANYEWWCITKGGEELFTGADTTPIADGDKFELTLMAG